MNLSRRSLTPVQVRLVDPDIRVVSPHATMNVQTSSPLSKLSFSMDVELYQLKIKVSVVTLITIIKVLGNLKHPQYVDKQDYVYRRERRYHLKENLQMSRCHEKC